MARKQYNKNNQEQQHKKENITSADSEPAATISQTLLVRVSFALRSRRPTRLTDTRSAWLGRAVSGWCYMSRAPT